MTDQPGDMCERASLESRAMAAELQSVGPENVPRAGEPCVSLQKDDAPVSYWPTAKAYLEAERDDSGATRTRKGSGA